MARSTKSSIRPKNPLRTALEKRVATIREQRAGWKRKSLKAKGAKKSALTRKWNNSYEEHKQAAHLLTLVRLGLRTPTQALQELQHRGRK